MAELRYLKLFEYKGDKPELVAYKRYNHTTLAYERQVADDLAKEHNLRDGEGHISVMNLEGEHINKLALEPR